MLVELNIIPLNGHTHVSSEIAEILKLVDSSMLPYSLTPTGTCIEGEWDQVMPLIKRCHERARELAPHVITNVRIEDVEGAQNRLKGNIDSV